jgi:lipoprotein NlpD
MRVAIRHSLLLTLVVAALGLAACAEMTSRSRSAATPPASGYYIVRAGDTLYSIASRFGLDYRAVARWNQLGDGSLIYPGQRLRLVPDGHAPRLPAAAPDPATDLPVVDWRWPAEGPVLASFGQSRKTASGIHIGGELGQPVRAAAAGEVVYAGSGLQGYGNLLIVRHNATYLSAYGYNEKLLAQEGQHVAAGQPIASLGLGPARRPLLHFEVRRNGEPVDPLAYLPARR